MHTCHAQDKEPRSLRNQCNQQVSSSAGDLYISINAPFARHARHATTRRCNTVVRMLPRANRHAPVLCSLACRCPRRWTTHPSGGLPLRSAQSPMQIDLMFRCISSM